MVVATNAISVMGLPGGVWWGFRPGGPADRPQDNMEWRHHITPDGMITPSAW